MIGFIQRWWQFLKERFEPFSSSLIILAFFAANAAMAWPLRAGAFLSPLRLSAGFVLVWCVFFHMRLFDEVKDYDFDREHNPSRPLARGLISIMEFGQVTLSCVTLEIGIAMSLGWPVFSAYVLLLAFTLLMRMEFFISGWLRPKLEIYAISHTFSASLSGMLIFSVVNGIEPVAAPTLLFYMALGNWFVFNVFEFGRKTFGPDEEKCRLDSYSFRLGPAGAVILLLLNLLAGYVLLLLACQAKVGVLIPGLVYPTGTIISPVVFSGLVYATKPSLITARVYRGTVSFYLLAYHMAIAVGAYPYLH
ncbi:MAG: hypothetical protein HQM09_06585 [Candidatus Riflebacteria bacterium]|nr:hypothetical protein [Candidatus Riflebacteria bacterium]